MFTSPLANVYVWWFGKSVLSTHDSLSLSLKYPSPPLKQETSRAVGVGLPFGWCIGTFLSWKSSGAGPEQPNANVDHEFSG